jgi:hypothetical protein
MARVYGGALRATSAGSPTSAPGCRTLDRMIVSAMNALTGYVNKL